MMKNIFRTAFPTIMLLSWMIFVISGEVETQSNAECEIVSFNPLELSASAGELVYVTFVDNTPVLASSDVRSTLSGFLPELPGVSGWQVSPDGLLMAGVHSTEEARNIVVFDRTGEQIYSGASAPNSTYLDWVGNDQIITFNWTRISRDPRLKTYYNVSYFLIDPFRRIYDIFTPSRDSFFYSGDRPIEGFTSTYDGRYLLRLANGQGNIFDLVKEKINDSENYRWGIPSTTTHKILIFENNQYFLDPDGDQEHSVYIYDINSDTLTITARLNTETRLRVLMNSWSPDETAWAYEPYDPSVEAGAFQQLSLLDLDTNETAPTCVGNVINLSWSRDSRYLAVQGVLEGHDMDESLGVYIYDTQTEDIYEVYRGRADVIGWMATPETEE